MQQWPPRGALVASAGGRAQDRHSQPRTRRLVCFLLVCGGACPALAAERTRVRQRCRADGRSGHGAGGGGGESPSLPQGGNAARQSAKTALAPEERRQTLVQSGGPRGQEAPEGEATAPRRPPQDGARAADPV